MTKLLFVPGSLRAASSSRALLRALMTASADDAEVAEADIGSLPHYNADLGEPPAVLALKAAITDADGLIFVTPEYNYGVPGVLKNAIDWASRPGYQSVLRGKPCLVVTTSGGALGGVRAQASLKYTLTAVLAELFPWQEIVVPFANDKLRDGRFADQAVLEFATAALTAFRRRLDQPRNLKIGAGHS